MNLSYAQVLAFLSDKDFSSFPALSFSILRNITMENIDPYLRYFGCKIGYDVKTKFGDYDGIFREAVAGSSGLLNEDTDCVMVFAHLEGLSPYLTGAFTNLDEKEIEDEIARIEEHIPEILSGIRKQTSALVLWHGIEPTAYPAWGILDNMRAHGQRACVQRINDALRKELHRFPSACFVDMEACCCRVGYWNFYDQRHRHMSRAPYSPAALAEIASEDFRFIRAKRGKNRKCIVLDCDNTLWGGIVGEDGINSIKLGKDYPGSPYYEFQQEILNLYNRGIIIALASKNNEEDVREVITEHPHMVLQESHIAIARINWNDKVSNIQDIARTLNIGLDSLVFVDDSKFEVELVNTMLPEVETILLPSDRPSAYRDIIASCGLFDTLALTEEDRKRTENYRQEINRQVLKSSASDIQSYLKSLEMVVQIRLADNFAIPRIAQQTQKTNQFNLTTKRYIETDVTKFIDDGHSVIYLKLTDRFGDLGIVGTCILRYDQGNAIMDSLLLSCRVLGRGLEDVFLSRVLSLARQRKCRQVIGEYIPTRKNAQVENFYPEHGFTHAGQTLDGQGTLYTYNLDNGFPPEPEYFRAIDSDF